MEWKSVSWDTPLGERPDIIGGGVGHRFSDHEEHYCVDFWCAYLIQCNLPIRLNDVPFPAKPGSVMLVPPHVVQNQHYTGDGGRHLFVHFRLPPGSPTARIPAMQYLAEDERIAERDFQQIIAQFPTNPHRAQIKLWDILWDWGQAAGQPVTPYSPHPAVVKARESISLHLAQPICVRNLARTAGLSQGHLTRLFRKTYGCTVAHYICACRVERAQYLLRCSDLPIKTVGIQVGIPDPHLFNKTIRNFLGKSPTRIRTEGP